MPFIKEKIELGIEEAELDAQNYWQDVPAFYRFLLIFAIVGIIPSYFVFKSVSGSLWLSRYQPLVAAAKPSFTSPKPLRVVSAKLFATGNGSYSLLAQLANDNADLSLDQAQFTARLYDASGQMTRTASDRFFILPGQSKYVIMPKIVSTVPLSRAEIVFDASLPWQKRLRVPSINVSATPPVTSLRTDPPATVLVGDVVNDSPYLLSAVRVIFLFYDDAGQIAGASSRDEFSLKPAEHRTYQNLWPGDAAAPGGRFTAQAESDPLDVNNLGIPDTGTDAGSLQRPPASQFQ